MIKCVAKLTIKQGMNEKFLAEVSNLIAKTKKEDAGCIAYDLYQDLQAGNIFVMIEEWRNPEDLDAHSKSKHLHDFQGLMAEIAEGVEIHLLKPAL
jgi:quinol monooxygenase YgiN